MATTEIKYKSIASVDQNDLYFLIPANNDTYIDLDTNFYIPGKLTKEDGTALNNTDFTAVKNSFLHSLFIQCRIALKGVPITQVAEIYNYESYFETILSYGIDAVALHPINAFRYLDDGDLLPSDPTAADAKSKISRHGPGLSRAKMSNPAVESTITSVTWGTYESRRPTADKIHEVQDEFLPDE